MEPDPSPNLPLIPAKAGTQAFEPGWFYAYIMASGRNGTLYVGHTENLIWRAHLHREHALPGFTAKYDFVHLVWYEPHGSRDSAFKRERAIKKWRRIWEVGTHRALQSRLAGPVRRDQRRPDMDPSRDPGRGRPVNEAPHLAILSPAHSRESGNLGFALTRTLRVRAQNLGPRFRGDERSWEVHPKDRKAARRASEAVHGRRVPILLALGVILGSCDQLGIREAKGLAAEQLKDPGAAQFRNLLVHEAGGKRYVCGEINGKNAFGAYVGFTRFYVDLDGQQAHIELETSEGSEALEELQAHRDFLVSLRRACYGA